jgi:hypothetical protein
MRSRIPSSSPPRDARENKKEPSWHEINLVDFSLSSYQPSLSIVQRSFKALKAQLPTIAKKPKAHAELRLYEKRVISSKQLVYPRRSYSKRSDRVF